ncbi:MAG: AAA family ATPase [Gemmatimonadetes bacterium]|nr:AAA family ATPase [Gemmatimonadota bacterium]
MKLNEVTIQDFRRFSDLVVRNIPSTAHLIVLVGPNGCGKSSFFDALHTWHTWKAKKPRSWDDEYHAKMGSSQRRGFHNQVSITFHDHERVGSKKTFYVRSAYRNSPDLQIQNLSQTTPRLDQVRVARLIDNDVAEEQTYHDLVSKGIEDLYEAGDGSTTFERYRTASLGVVRDSLREMFPDLLLNSLGNPLREGTFRFTKGISEGFHFKNLSGGEKAAFDLILDLAIAAQEYDDTVFCIDEPESHLHARLQGPLLSVLCNIVPDNCQLMLATHSAGMIRQARDMELNTPGSVAFLDFDRDFDTPVVIEPASPGREFWKRVYHIALDDLSELLAPERVVICEGEPRNRQAAANYAHDARCYEKIFGEAFPETEFVPGGGAKDVVSDKRGVAYVLRCLTKGVTVWRLIDRDNRSQEEVEELERHDSKIRVLGRRNLESYLFDDEVLRALAVRENADETTVENLLEEKGRLVAESSGAPDDLKPCSGGIYNACKDILGLKRCGNDAKAFMRVTLAPLLTDSMGVYAELRRDIFGL